LLYGHTLVRHQNVLDELVSEASKALSEISIGPGDDEATTMGPLVSETQRQRVLGYVDKGISTGATALLEGGAVRPEGHEGGYYVRPMLLAGGPDNVCAKEEIFGPVAYVIPSGTSKRSSGASIVLVTDLQIASGAAI